MTFKDLNEQQIKSLVYFGILYLKQYGELKENGTYTGNIETKEDLIKYLENVRTGELKEALQ